MFPRTLLILVLALTTTAALAVADDELVKLDRGIVVIDDGTEATIRLDDGRLQIVTRKDGDASVHEFDLAGLGELIDGAVAEAMRGLEATLDEDLTIAVDNGRMVHVKQGDRALAFDARLIAEEVKRSLASLHEDLGRELDHARDVRHAPGQDEMAELEAEIDQLKAELQDLRDSLDRIR
jgi:hypothetical protein